MDIDGFENVKDYFENILNSLKIEVFGGRWGGSGVIKITLSFESSLTR